MISKSVTHLARPVIGISLSLDRGRRIRTGADYYYVRRAYAEAISQAGAVPILLTLDTPQEAAVELCDGFVVTGGDDLPRSFAEVATSLAETAEDAERIRWDRELFNCIAAKRKPVLGVCYGMQLMNLHHGGSLYERVRLERPGSLDHGGDGETTHHELVVAGGRLLAGFAERLRVNSRHRQAVERVAPGFRVTAHASDGVVEAIECEHWFGVEWHPETDIESTSIYRNFVEIVKAGRFFKAGGEP